MPAKFLLKTRGHQNLELESGVDLSRQLDATSSPILFGCRTGICGTCLVNILEGKDNTNPPSDDERELLEIIAEDYDQPRLACQLKCQGDISLEYIGK